jgi:hypothetical protein
MGSAVVWDVLVRRGFPLEPGCDSVADAAASGRVEFFVGAPAFEGGCAVLAGEDEHVNQLVN